MTSRASSLPPRAVGNRCPAYSPVSILQPSGREPVPGILAVMRLLLADLSPAADLPQLGSALEDAMLASLYAVPAGPMGWLRANVVSSLDGAAAGPDGRTRSINTEADHVVFEMLRALSDVVLLGAGTARVEGYTGLGVSGRWAAVRAAHGLGPVLPLVIVTRRGGVPPSAVAGARDAGPVLLITCASAPNLVAARDLLGAENVLVCGDAEVDLVTALAEMHRRGWHRVLTEGGPHLLGSLLCAGLVDEVCLSIAPGLCSGVGLRVAAGPALDVGFVPRVLVEEDGTLMGRWFRR